MKKRTKPTACLMILLSLVMVLALSGCQMLSLWSAKQKTEHWPVEEQMKTMAPSAVDYGAQPPFNTVEFGTIEENTWKTVTLHPFSTFAADVDTAAYATVRNYLMNGSLPPADAVRVEELINYFRYDYPAPQAGAPFGVSLKLTDTPWNAKTKLLFVGVATEPLQTFARQPANFVFLIDVSGSMDAPDKLGLVKQAFLMLTENLHPDDTISIVTYAGMDQVLADGLTGNDKTEIMALIENLSAGGTTHGSAGITTAYELAEKYFDEEKNNRVILATDGDLNIGITSEGELTDLIKEKKETGVFLSVMGFGLDNLKDNKLVALANNGNGNYGYIDSVLEARKLLVEDMGGTLQTVAKDVKFQVEFNPLAVKGYRLIGYEDRLMNAEDFADDKKDGGEIGAGHRVTILYEIADLDSSQELPEVNGKYKQTGEEIVSTFADELLTLSIRYKEPNGDKSSLLQFPLEKSAYSRDTDSNMELAGALAAFGMLLRDSEFKGNASYDAVTATLNALPEKDDYITELIFLVNQAKRLSEAAGTDEPVNGIDETEALARAKTYLMENLPDWLEDRDLNASDVYVLTEDDVAEAASLLEALPDERQAGELKPGDYLVAFDVESPAALVVAVAASDGSLLGYIPTK